MANAEQLALLKAGVEGWNRWREEEPDKEIDLSGADLPGVDLHGLDIPGQRGIDLNKANLSHANLHEANLSKADLSHANLSEADLSKANLWRVNLSGAVLSGARFTRADLSEANLSEADLSSSPSWGTVLIRAKLSFADLSYADLSQADLRGTDLAEAILREANLSEADLRGAFLYGANLSGANLSGADLSHSNLVQANINNAKISKSNVYGVNVWDLDGEFKEQKDLVITPLGQASIAVDNIKVAQFVYLILNNKEVRDVINTLTSKSVLILGRFADDKRKAILDALRNKLREYNLLPIVFDFDRPVDRNITETVKTLAAISYFVIADVTSPKSSPLELQAIVPDFQIPVVPIIQESELPFSMIADLQSQHDGVLAPLTYQSEETLIKVLKDAVIDPAIEKHRELRLIKAQRSKIRKAEDFVTDQGLDNQD